MKRTLSLVLALVMVLGSFSTVFAAEQTVEEKAGAFLKEQGVLVGDTTSGDLMLGKGLKRQDAVVLLSRLMGEFETAKEFPTSETSPTYEDVRVDANYLPYLAWAQANKTFVGHSDAKFGFGDNLTTQEYASVLLRVLGYEVKWDETLAKAEELGLLADIDVKADFVRGNMAVMTLNALGAKVKDSTVTLAEKLEIEMPAAPAPATLEVVSVNASNLREIEVKFNRNVEKIEAEKITNYLLDGAQLPTTTVISLQEDEQTVIISLPLSSLMLNQAKHKLTVKDIVPTQVVNEFIVLDITVPEVVGVEALGTKAVRVTFSEPVTQATAELRTNYILNGYVVNGTVKLDEATGRVVTITPYTALATGAHKISVKNVRDLTNKEMINVIDRAFEVEVDKVAPEFTVVSATLNQVIIEFSEAIDPSTAKNTNVYWSDNNGVSKVTSDSFAVVKGNQWRIRFNDNKNIPAKGSTLYVTEVKDYSGNKITATSVAITPEVDTVRPEVVSVDFPRDAFGKATATNQLEVTFNKIVPAASFGTSEDLRDNLIIKDADKKIVARANAASTIKDATKYPQTLVVTLNDTLEAGENYTVEISNVNDGTVLKNTMIPQVFTVVAEDTEAPQLVSIITGNNLDFVATFDKVMMLGGEGSVLNYANYMVQWNGKWYNMPSTALLRPTEDNKGVIIEIPSNFKLDGQNNLSTNGAITGIRVSMVKSAAGNLLDSLVAELTGLVANDVVAIEKAEATSKRQVIVTFDQPLQMVYEGDFRVGADTPNTISYETKAGKGIVTLGFTTDKIAVDAAGAIVTVVGSPVGTRTLLGTNVVVAPVAAADKIAPTTVIASNATGEAAKLNIVSVSADYPSGTTYTADAVEVQFTEVLVPFTTDAAALAHDFVVTYGENSTKLIPGVDYLAVLGTNVTPATTADKVYIVPIKAGFTADRMNVKLAETVNLLQDAALNKAKGMNHAVKTGIVKETVEPTVDGTLVVVDSTTVQVTFSEKVKKAMAQDIANYVVTETVSAVPATLAVSKAVLAADGKTVTLTIAEHSVLSASDTIEVVVSAVQDLAGNVVDSGNDTATYTE